MADRGYRSGATVQRRERKWPTALEASLASLLQRLRLPVEGCGMPDGTLVRFDWDRRM